MQSWLSTSWKMIPTLLPSVETGHSLTRWLATISSPSVAPCTCGTMPFRHRPSVLFPAPLAPSTRTNSPREISKERSRSTGAWFRLYQAVK